MKSKEIGIEAQKELQRLDGEIAKLTAERTRIANILKASEMNGKSGALVAAPEAMPRDVAIQMLGEHKTISPTDVADRTGIRKEYASALLTKLVKEKIAKKVDRGVYTRNLSGKR
jgi:hypothetical protein